MIRTYQKALAPGYSGGIKATITNIVEKLIGEIHTSSVGIIEAFDTEKQIATIQPAIKYLDYSDEGEEYTLTDTKYPLLVNVPVVFPGGGDWHLTFPVAKGDECLLVYTERSIANWRKFGGVRDQSQIGRRHSMKDAFAIVGLNAQANSLPQFNGSEPELRNRSGDTRITLGASGMTLKGNLTVEGTVDATGAISSDGEITGSDVKTTIGTSLTTHTTSGVTPGAGVSGPPTPGT